MDAFLQSTVGSPGNEQGEWAVRSGQIYQLLQIKLKKKGEADLSEIMNREGLLCFCFVDRKDLMVFQGARGGEASDETHGGGGGG